MSERTTKSNNFPDNNRIVHLIYMFFLLAVPLLVSCQSLPWRHRGYDVEFTGIDGKSEKKNLQALSEAWASRNDREVDLDRLDHHFRADSFNMERYLRASGYCDAKVTLTVITNARRPKLVFDIQGTNVFLVRSVSIKEIGYLDEATLALTNSLIGERLDFAKIDLVGRKLVRALKNTGYPRAAMENKTALVDYDKREVEVEYALNPGSSNVMGTHSIHGLRLLKPKYVEKRINWKPGTPYKQDTIDEFSRKLTESSLFSFVDISGPPASATNEPYDVAIRLQERRRRTIGLGVGYQSDLGPEATTFWQHRNLFGMGERFELDAKYSEDLWLGKAVLTFPDVFELYNELDLGLKASAEDSDAYYVHYEMLYAELRHRINSQWSLHYGPSLRRSKTTQLQNEDTYLQLSFPVGVQWNKRDDVIDPTEGFSITAQTEPFYDLQEEYGYLKTLLTPAVYIPLVKDQLSLGLRVTVGSISGSDISGVPADLRFYAGGGQSIRGYEYQSVGPRTEGQPIGGKSLLESSMELRWRFQKNLGVVLFLDGGSAYEPEISDFSESYQWGAGIGFRYFTGVGPIRIDFGVPVNPRDGIDHNFEFYISIGQAF